MNRHRRKFYKFFMIIALVLFLNIIIISCRNYARSNDRNEIFIDNKLKLKRNQTGVKCELLFESNINEIQKVNDILKIKNFNIPDSNYIFDKKECNQFRYIRGYDNYPVRDTELEFPLAFSILTYENVEQFERLLRLIYRPHNIYCIHVDAKSTLEFHYAIQSITQCFDNVFIASKLERIVYAGIGRLKADINCMTDLLKPERQKNGVKWKYYLNLASTEFPLRTNYELTRILRLFNGGNDIEVMKNVIERRVFYEWKEVNGELISTDIRKSSPPHNFTIVKGLAYGMFSYKFVDFIVNNKYAKDLLEWLKDIYSPDEVYWATLHHNTQFNPPGGFKSDWKYSKRVNTTSRFVIWGDNIGCQGQYVHGVCVFSSRDLATLVKRHEAFANKFILSYNPIAYECMEEWLLSKIMSPSYMQTINIIDYCNHPVIKAYNNISYCDVNLITY